MLYRRMRRKRIHFNTYAKPMPRAQRILLFLMTVFLVLVAVIFIIFAQLRPVIFKMAKTAVTDVVGIEVNDVITEETLNGSFDYSKLITLEKDNYGNITALVTNTAMINTLQTRISKGVFKYVSNEVINDLKIPIGNVMGSLMFSGWGPNFTVKILSIADVDTKITNSYEPAGINQTRLKIYLDVWVDINIVVSGFEAKTITATTQVAVVDTIIVGRVPNVYADLGEG